MPKTILAPLAALLAFAQFTFAQALPPEVAEARAQVLQISAENTLRTDNIAAVRAELMPHLDILAEWFAANRPANEVELTQQPWKNLWYDDPDIEFGANLNFGFFSLQQDRASIYQVVQDGYYYNVSESTLTLFGIPFRIQNFLKGAYEVAAPAGPGNVGEAPLNIVALEFVANSIRPGSLPKGFPLDPLVYLVELGWIPTIDIPGPLGVTGQLWNLYVDEEVRFAAGYDEAEPDVLDLYILRRAQSVE